MTRRFFTYCLTISLLSVPFLSVAQDDAPALEEIVVTATKREQSTQDIPMSVAAIDGAAILQRGISDMSELSEIVPSFIVTNSASNKVIAMRGIGAPAGQRGTEQSIAMFVDGIYMPRSKQYYSAFLDVDRVEILRGPQAVLFGVNATAGAVSVVSASNRGGDELEGAIRLENELERIHCDWHDWWRSI